MKIGTKLSRHRYLRHRYLRHRYLISAFALCLSLSCGTWAGNPVSPDSGGDKSEVALEIQGSDGASLNLAAGDVDVSGKGGTVIGSISLSKARVSLKKIKLEASDGSEGGDQEFKGPYVVDLLNNVTTPSIESIQVPTGDYSRIKLQLAKLEEGEAEGVVPKGDTLIGNSIHMIGTYHSNQNSSVSFEMTFDLDEEFFISLEASASSFKVEAGVVNTALITFALNKWFDFSGSSHDLDDLGESNIVLSKDSEEESKKAREAIKDNVKSSAEFEKKED